MSILFSDIRDFTSLSERMSPQENFTFLNSYLGRIGPLVREHGGFIDKYIGDAIMGLFPTKAQHALSAAIALQEEVRRFNQDRAAAGEEGIKIGIGLHRGWLMLGTIGESERMDTTVIADAVNLASRLEGLTKVFGVGLIVSEAIVQGLDDASAFHFRSLGAVRPKGKSESCEIFEVYDGDLPSVFEEKEKSSSLFAGAVAEFRAGKFASAERTFGDLAAATPADGAAAHFRDRCAELKTQTGVERWDGVERFEFK
jgi:two-component system sensor histidine kinase ChiS